MRCVRDRIRPLVAMPAVREDPKDAAAAIRVIVALPGALGRANSGNFAVPHATRPTGGTRLAATSVEGRGAATRRESFVKIMVDPDLCEANQICMSCCPEVFRVETGRR